MEIKLFMALEYMFFGYLACYLAFYFRAKRNLPLHEKDTRKIFIMFFMLTNIGVLRLFGQTNN
jgi:hypothetical protein